ncbi:hypothetical protein [Sphingobacterium kyonggiense]
MKKRYETRMINAYEFYDYRNLKQYPLYIKFVKRKYRLLWIDLFPSEELAKIDSLQALKWFLDENDWVYERKYFKMVCQEFQSEINLPYS